MLRPYPCYGNIFEGDQMKNKVDYDNLSVVWIK